MSTAHQRQKQPELVRSQLLAVVRELVATEGPHAATLDAVSRRAGVSKGGLQHHFSSKQALLDALCDQLFDTFHTHYQAQLATEAPGPARHARAYVRTCFDAGNELAQVETQRAIGQLALGLPACRERWATDMRAALAADGDDPASAQRLLVCRLAADGFWFSRMLDVYALDAAQQAQLCERLLRLCDEATA